MSNAAPTSDGPPPLVGNGYVSEPITLDGSTTRESLWTQMCNKITHPEDFLPVSNVRCEDREGGCVWRTMDFTGPGPMHGKTVVEHIYANQAGGEIRFVVLDEAGKETDVEVVNALLADPVRIEYCMRSAASRERLDWKAPLASCVAAINLTIQKAAAGGGANLMK